MDTEKGGMLAPYRALDLTDEKGFLCGKILADLGADVIKVEKPGGNSSRKIAPFYHNIPEPEKSLNWFAYNLNKRGITLNIETSGGKEIFKALIKTAAFVIESFPPGYMDSLGLGYSSLCRIHPGVIMTSITPFGQNGPYKDYKACDLTLIAMGGLLYITGYPDMPPVRISFPQSSLLAGSHAAGATMVAHYHRMLTGEGQLVDVSIQSSVAWVITNTVSLWELNKINLQRQGSFISGRAAGARLRTIWQCKDGFIAYALHGGQAGVSMGNPELIKWMDEERMADDFIKSFDWDSYDLKTATQDMQSRLEGYLEKFFVFHTKAELYRGGLERSITIYPVYSPKDIVEDPQLKERDFWVQVKHPELNVSISYPGTFFKTSESPFRIRGRAPLVGEHNREVYAELGLSEKDLIALKQATVI